MGTLLHARPINATAAVVVAVATVACALLARPEHDWSVAEFSGSALGIKLWHCPDDAIDVHNCSKWNECCICTTSCDVYDAVVQSNCLVLIADHSASCSYELVLSERR